MKERLRRSQKQIFEYAKQKDLIASTYHCTVKVLTRTEDRYFHSVIVTSEETVDDNKGKAIGKTTAKIKSTANQKQNGMNKSNLKKLRSSLGKKYAFEISSSR